MAERRGLCRVACATVAPMKAGTLFPPLRLVSIPALGTDYAFGIY